MKAEDFKKRWRLNSLEIEGSWKTGLEKRGKEDEE